MALRWGMVYGMDITTWLALETQGETLLQVQK